MTPSRRWVLRRPEPFAVVVDDPKDSVFAIISSPARDVTNTTRMIFVYSKSLNGPLPTYYVRTAMYRLPLEGVESVSTKCPVEKQITEQEYVKVTPVPETEPTTNEDAMNLLKLTKRLTLCTSCGTLRLIN